jgi:hypothetical protein
MATAAKATGTGGANAQSDAKAEKTEKPYEVISRLDYDGERYEAGDEVMLTDKVAKDLIGHTVVAKV